MYYDTNDQLWGNTSSPIINTVNLGGSKKSKKKLSSRKKKSTTKTKSTTKRKPKVYTGKRGGEYIIKNKRKVYLSSTQR